MRFPKSIVSLVALMLCTVPLLVHADSNDIYKWIDGHGITHYSQLPPTGYPFTLIKSPANNSTGIPSSGTQSPPAASSTPQPQPVKRAEIPDIKQRCEIARKDILTLQSARRIRVVKPDGQVEWLNENQRASNLKNAQNFVSHFCSGN